MFLGFPIAEIAVFIMVGSAIGVLPTIALIILSAVLGLTLLRNRGLSALSRVRADLENDRVPADALAEAMSVAIAGILLIIPGFITDTIGLLLLLPGVRRGLGRKMSRSTTFVDATF
ncbi:MAG: FxsA family protein, partial [Pseudomonadota bacterium]